MVEWDGGRVGWGVSRGNREMEREREKGRESMCEREGGRERGIVTERERNKGRRKMREDSWKGSTEQGGRERRGGR